MPELRKVSGEKAVKILCNKLGFSISGRTGSHVENRKFYKNSYDFRACSKITAIYN